MSKKKSEIYSTAAVMFKEKGYLATSMRDLAVSVGLEPSSLYSHIRSKEEILQSHLLGDRRAIYGPHGRRPWRRTCIILEQIESMIRFHVRTAVEEPTSITVFNDEWRNLSEPALTEFMETRKAYENGFLSMLNTGIKNGALKDLNPLIMMHTILSAVKWVPYWKKKKKTFTTAELEDQLVEQVLGGIKK